MIVNVKRRELLAQLKKVAKAVPAEHAPAEVKGIFFEADERAGVVKMTSTNFEVAIRSTLPAPVEKGGGVIIDSKLFHGMLDLFPVEDVYGVA